MRRSGRSVWSFGAVVMLMSAVLWASMSCRKETNETVPVEAVRSLAAIVATCASADGDVQVRRAGGTTWEPVRAGAVFREGDEVKTASLSTARLEFLEGGGLEMEERTSVIVDLAASANGTGAGERRVALKEGVLRGLLPRGAEGAAAGGLVISTGDGEQVRLTGRQGEESTIRISRRDKGVELAALAGNVTVLTDKGRTDLEAGSLVMAAGGQVADLAKLIDFPQSVEPEIDARFRFRPDLAILLVWSAVPGAIGYRVQLAQDLSFRRIEQIQDVEGTQIRLTPAGPGARAWRVASRDASGRLGEYGFARRFQCEKIEPRDLLVGPADGAVVKLAGTSPRVTFSWQSAGERRSYRLVVAGGPNLLERMTTSVRASGQSVELKAPAVGEYWWGVYEEEGKELVPLFSAPRRLLVQRPARPEVKLPRAISSWGE